ncbi:unnamed protein product [Penicillium crustosum]
MRKCTCEKQNGPNRCQSATLSVWAQYLAVQEENLKKGLLSQVSWAALDVKLTVATLSISEPRPRMSLHLGQLQKNYGGTSWLPSQNHMISAGQRLLVRGGTSSLGRAAISLAVQAGVYVTATTRTEKRISQLEALRVWEVLIEGPQLSERISDKFDAILELIGNITVVDLLKMARRGGRVCLAGFLGGLAPILDFNPLL